MSGIPIQPNAQVASNQNRPGGFADLMPLVHRLEQTRLVASRKVRAHLVGFAFFAVIGVALLIFLKHVGIPIVLFLIVVILAAAFTIPKDLAIYKRKYKAELVRAVVKKFSPSLEYFPEQGASVDDLMGTLLFSRRPNRFKSEDLVKGTYNDVNVAFSEIRSHLVTTKGTGKNRDTDTEQIFNGVLFYAQFNKKFKTTTLVYPDIAEKVFGKMGQFFQSLNATMTGGQYSASNLQLIRLDDPEFEKHFSVYGQDQVEARYILTHSFMQRLLGIGQRKRGRVSVSFRENLIAIAVSSLVDLFEAPLIGKVDAAHVGQAIESIAGYLAIVDELKLNEKLWA